jgi:hypothetical protein
MQTLAIMENVTQRQSEAANLVSAIFQSKPQ